MDLKLEGYLKNHKIEYKIHIHPPFFTVIESNKIEKNIPGMHCKTLFMKDDKGNFYLIGMNADKRLNTKILREHLGIRKLHFASPSELNKELKIEPGSVSIFNLVNSTNKNIRLIIDEEVWQAKIVGFHPNINTETLEIKHKDLERYYNSLSLKKEILKI
ncbi:hypothetical protein AUJ84_00140 [Candidatus Pacearchaeota archaeon CG1_02_32_132]|nr:MAG: hypothetical protein AUJ84_00140 [Candidatus Pacearchaeota archaeon CG1_02_32_132]